MSNKQRLIWSVYYPMITKKYFAICIYATLGVFGLSLCLGLLTGAQLFFALAYWSVVAHFALGAWAVAANHVANFKYKRAEKRKVMNRERNEASERAR